jgi:hypothetical protein
MPPDKLCCPALAIGALKDALAKRENLDGLTEETEESVIGAKGA